MGLSFDILIFDCLLKAPQPNTGLFLFHVEGAKIHSIECMCEILYKRSKQY